jgi:hypothetical protein
MYVQIWKPDIKTFPNEPAEYHFKKKKKQNCLYRHPLQLIFLPTNHITCSLSDVDTKKKCVSHKNKYKQTNMTTL